MKETVVTFNNGTRKVSMYFTEDGDNLDMQMVITPEFKDGDEPDLPMMLASTFLEALNVKKEDESEPTIITTG